MHPTMRKKLRNQVEIKFCDQNMKFPCDFFVLQVICETKNRETLVCFCKNIEN
jgi:hypothetical protein